MVGEDGGDDEALSVKGIVAVKTHRGTAEHHLHIYTVHQQYQRAFLLFQTDAHNYKNIGILK